jgi:acyl-CoA oxidase
LLATAFALHYTGSAMQALYEITRADISKGDFSRLAELHSQSSGLKSLCTDYAANGIETCRRALGGHGFGGGSGLIQLNSDYLSKPTVEGDNWMITQQTANYLIKRMAAAEAQRGEPQDEVERSCREYLSGRIQHSPTDFNILKADADIIRAFQRRSRYLTHLAHTQRNKEKKSWNSLLLLLRKVSHAESESLLVANFAAALKSSDAAVSSDLRLHLRRLFGLYAYHTMDMNAREFAKARAASEEDLDELPQKIQHLMAEIRPHAVNLVDSWCIPDFLLDSALGRYDGKVYEDLFNRAHRLNPLNETTFNSDYRSEEIVRGGDGKELSRILAKL